MSVAELLIGTTRTFGLVALIAAGFGWVISARVHGRSRAIALGLLFSAGGMMSMTDPLVLAPGVIFDGRAVVISLAYAFSGLLGTLIVAALLALYRLWIGGAGALAGVLGIAIATLVAAAFHRIPKHRLRHGLLRTVLLGLAGSTSTVSLFVLPTDLALKIVHDALLPIVLGNVFGVVVLSLFLGREEQRLRLMRTLEHDAAVDPLTKLVNRRVFERIAESVERRAQTGEEGFAMVMFDVDHFKRVNDTLGHQTGDEVLKGIASIVRDVMRAGDIVARYGGEEIVVLMPGTSIEVAAGMAERVRARVELELARSHEWASPVTVSAGVASSTAQSPTVLDVMRHADRAMYRAKSDGRNRVQAGHAEGGVLPAAA